MIFILIQKIHNKYVKNIEYSNKYASIFFPIIKIILRMDSKVDFVGIYLLFVHIII